MRIIKERIVLLDYVVSTVNEPGAGYTTPFMDLTRDTIYRVVSSGTDSGKTILTLNSNGKETVMYVNKRFRQPYKNELKKVL